MRVVRRCLIAGGAVLTLGAGCAPPAAVRGVPVPAGVKVRLRFARYPGTTFRYQVRTREEFGPNQGIHIKTDRIIYDREMSEDSLEAHVIIVGIDSTQGGPGGMVDRGPYVKFTGWYNDLRRRIDTLAGDVRIERLRNETFRTTVPLPAEAVGVGDSWNFAADDREPFFRSADVRWTATARATVISLLALGDDTIATFNVTYHLNGKLPNPNGDPVYVTGTIDGQEQFSVATGMSVSLHTNGQVFWTTSVNTLGGLQRMTMVIKSSIARTLLR